MFRSGTAVPRGLAFFSPLPDHKNFFLLPAASRLIAYRYRACTDSVEILRDHWGVPHIYAKNSNDLFFAQGFITAKDRLFQIDLWRRIGTGNLPKCWAPKFLSRDRIARLVRYRGDWNRNGQSYSPDAKDIATAFIRGINAYINRCAVSVPPNLESRVSIPALWSPEDVTARVAGLLMTGNMLAEVQSYARCEEAWSRQRRPSVSPESAHPSGFAQRPGYRQTSRRRRYATTLPPSAPFTFPANKAATTGW